MMRRLLWPAALLAASGCVSLGAARRAQDAAYRRGLTDGYAVCRGEGPR